MLFSATIPDSIVAVAKTILKPNYLTISTIPQGDTNTHKRVAQYLITVPTVNDLAPTIVSVVTCELASSAPGLSLATSAGEEFKAIIFAPTAVLSDFYTHILTHTLPSSIKVLTMHARMSQPKRTATSNEFRTSKNAICIATDVIARGMDFPKVTHVFQIGLPMSRESYVHRLGRTARAGKEGVGIFILAEAEKTFLRELKDIRFLHYPHPISTSQIQGGIEAALETLDEEKKGKIYQGWLGYYKAMTKFTRWDKEELVETGNKFALEGLRCAEVPGLEASIVGKMGMKGTKGLRVVPNKPRAKRGGGRGEERGDRVRKG
jgi:ATP-dependent RNA helicase MSS116